MIPYEDLRKANEIFFKNFQASFANSLDSGWFILGKNVAAFEQEWAHYVGAKHAVGVASGLDALVIALKALELPAGSAVVVPSNTYIATILAIMQCNLCPILVEPDLATYNIDPKRIAAAITPNTMAIMVVHLYGKACDMGPIVDIAIAHRLKLIEDCAQSHGAKYCGKTTGTFGEFGAFSFYPTKNLGALGDAGALVTDDPELARRARLMRNYGSEKKYYNEVVGMNSRLDEVQAGLLRIKLAHLDQINAHKRKLARIYFRELTDAYVKPIVGDEDAHVFHIFNVRHPRRDQLKHFLWERHIGTEIHYPVAPHRQRALSQLFTDSAAARFPLSEEIHDTTLSLPISFCHTEDDVYRVVEAMNEFTRKS